MLGLQGLLQLFGGPLLLGGRDPGEHRQREDLAGGLLGGGEVPGAVPEFAERSLEVKRHRIVDPGPHAGLLQSAQHGVAAGHAHDIEMPHGLVAGADPRQRHVGGAAEQGLVPRRRLTARSVPGGEARQLGAEHDGLKRIQSGVDAEVVPTGLTLDLDYPAQVHAPFTIMIEDIDDPVQGFHKHIDMIYFCRLVGNAEPLNDGWQWVSKEALDKDLSLQIDGEQSEPPPEDVRLLAKHAFELISREP